MANYLMHHGVKGQKWGVRRYQNEDGSLTAKGKQKYSSEESGPRTYGQRVKDAWTDPNRKNPVKAYGKKVGKEWTKVAKKSANNFNQAVDNRTKGRGVGKIIVNGLLKEVGILAVGGLASSAAYATGHDVVGRALEGATSGMAIANTGITVVAAIKRGRGQAKN